MPTYDKGLLGLRAVLIVPGRPPGSVDGPFAGAQQRGLRLALAGGPLSGRLGGAHRRVQPVQRLGAAVAGEKEGTVGSTSTATPPATLHLCPNPILYGAETLQDHLMSFPAPGSGAAGRNAPPGAAELLVPTLLCGLQPLSAPSYLRQEGEEQTEPRAGTWQQDTAAAR